MTDISPRPTLNPYSLAGFFSKMNFSWVTPKIDECSSSGFTQKKHYPLTPDMDVQVSVPSFEREFNRGGNLFGLMVRIFSSKCFLSFLIVINVALEISEIALVYMLASELKGVSPEHPADPYRVAAYFAIVILVQYFCHVVETFATFLIYNRMTAIKNSFVVQIIRQVFKVNVSTADGASKGNVLNLVQVDCENIQTEGAAIFLLLYNVLILVCCFVAGFFLLGGSFGVFMGSNIVIAGLSWLLYEFSTKYTEKMMEVRDSKLTLLANLFTNIRFVKFNVLEGFFAKIVNNFRNQELGLLKTTFCIVVFLAFLDWFNPAFSMAAMIWTYFLTNKLMSGELFLASQQMGNKVYIVFANFPSVFSLIAKFLVMFRRMRQFFDIKPNDKRFLTHSVQVSDLAIEIRNGSFSHSSAEQEKFNKMCEDYGDGPRKSLLENQIKEKKMESGSEAFRLQIGDLKVKSGDLVFVIGRIGSGKSSLMNALLGEMSAAPETSVYINGRVSYCSQQPFMMAKTIRENITFYREFDERRFDESVELAYLSKDLVKLKGPDRLLSEGGMNVSGGQRSRINLARCFYGDADIYLFDDPFSALDVNVSSHIIENAVVNHLKGKTRIVVTHSVQYLHYADSVVCLDGGKVSFQGSYQQFQSTHLFRELEAMVNMAKSPNNSVVTSRADLNTSIRLGMQNITARVSRLHQSNYFKPDEEKEFVGEAQTQNTQKDRFFELFGRYYGGRIVLFLMILSVCGIYYCCYWAESRFMVFLAQKKEDWNSVRTALIQFTLILVAPTFLHLIRSGIEVAICVHASRKLHKKMTIRTLHAELLNFFDKIETGQLLNRFSRDMATVDTSVQRNIAALVCNMSMALVDIWIVGENFSFWVWALILVYLIALWRAKGKYIGINKDAVRLDAMTREPVVNLISEVIIGRDVINIFNQQEPVLNEVFDKLNENTKNVLFRRALQSWFNVRLMIYSLVIVQLPLFAYYVYTIKLMGDPALLALSITYLFSLIRNVKMTLEALVNLELDFVAVERCDAFEKIKTEKNYLNYAAEEKDLMDNLDSELRQARDYLWIREPNPEERKFEISEINAIGFRKNFLTNGEIKFVNVSAGYPGAKRVSLSKVSFDLKSGEKMGIVGETGSGKSTTIKILTRYLRQGDGIARIDGYDISQLDLKQLRSEILVINQEIALFDGTILENMCPEFIGRQRHQPTVNIDQGHQEPLLEQAPLDREALESEIKDCLIRFGFSKEKLAEKGLDFRIATGGVNLSPGEQQLIAIFRALFTDKKIIILDEATASIDYETEKLLTEYLFKKIQNKTLISIAHRLSTVVDCNKIIVMKDGKIMEMGNPKRLIDSDQSLFGAMYKKANKGFQTE